MTTTPQHVPGTGTIDHGAAAPALRRGVLAGGARSRRHGHRRRLARNDVVFRTASGTTLIAAGPTDRRWLRSPVPRRNPAA
jgi:glycine/D-amino acid oxidase-like deaminating enzyme